MTIPIFYTISDNFTKYAIVSLYSLVQHTDRKQDYTIYFIHQDLSEQNKNYLSELATENVHVKFFKINDAMVAPIQNRHENFLRADFFTMSIFYRLFIPELFPQYDKVVYLDSDTVVNDDIAKLANTNLENNLFAACTDSSIQFVQPMLDYIRNVLALDPKKYINSGMLVMNAKLFRQEHFIEHFFDLLKRYHFDCIAPDQDYLNEMCSGRIHYLNPRWDAMPNENTAPLTQPGLIHYNLFFKPWHFKGVQYEGYFWQNARQTPFYAELKEELAQYTPKMQADDRQKLNTMLAKGKYVVNDPDNWAHVKQREAVSL